MSLERLLVVGLDGGTFDALTPLAEAGVMPHLAALMKRSALAELQSTQPAITPTAWATFLTGCDPQRHGVFDYRWLDRAGTLRLNHAAQLRCPTLFDRVMAAGGEVVSINLPMTAARRDGRGVIVGGIDETSIDAALAPFPALAAELQRRDVQLSLKTVWKRRPQSFEELAAGVAATELDFLARSGAALAADALADWRLMVVQFQTLDCLQHRLWHLFDFAGGAGPSAWTAEVYKAFAALDRALGELLELAERRGAGVAALSDHGFGAFREKISVPELLRRRGLLRPQTHGQRLSYRAARWWLKLRKWSGRRLSAAASAAGVRRSLAALLPIDWRTSVSFSAHGNLGALIYLNSRARFGAGPVATQADEDQATADTIAALREARHPDTDEALFVDVYRTAELFGLDPVEQNLPDVVGIPADGFHTRHKFDRGAKLMRPDADLTGTHRRSGVLLARVPGAAVGTMHAAELRDMAPTILHWLGCPADNTMDGRVLGALTHGAAPAPNSHAGPARERNTLPAMTTAVADDEEIVLQRLRDLGYLD